MQPTSSPGHFFSCMMRIAKNDPGNKVVMCIFPTGFVITLFIVVYVHWDKLLYDVGSIRLNEKSVVNTK